MAKKPKTKVREAGDPCPCCYELAREGRIRVEAVQPLHGGARDSLSRRPGVGKICRDCAAAEMVNSVLLTTMDFADCRVVTANERQASYRLPGTRAFGLFLAGYMKPSQPGELESHHAWLTIRVPEWTNALTETDDDRSE